MSKYDITSYSKRPFVPGASAPFRQHLFDTGETRTGRHAPGDKLDITNIIELQPGDILFREGDPSGYAGYIESGELEIEVKRYGKPLLIGKLGVGKVVGEMGAVSHEPRSATLRATQKTTVRVIPAEVITDMILRVDPGVQALIHTLMERLRDTNKRFVTDPEDDGPREVSRDYLMHETAVQNR